MAEAVATLPSAILQTVDALYEVDAARLEARSHLDGVVVCAERKEQVVKSVISQYHRVCRHKEIVYRLGPCLAVSCPRRCIFGEVGAGNHQSVAHEEAEQVRLPLRAAAAFKGCVCCADVWG